MTNVPEFRTIDTNGVTLNVATAGPEGGPLVILLHGFPEFWYGWRHQIGRLAEAGYRILAPDQRGYNLSAKPTGIASYAVDVLARDVIGLIDATGRDRAAIVGHDWGGIVAWWAALAHRERLDRLGIINAPHPLAFRKQLWTSPAQLLKSWYVFAFQLPRLPEAALRRNNWRGLVRGLIGSSRPGTFTEADLQRYREAWSRPGAITTMIHWYRAAIRARPPAPAEPRVSVPTLLIWGARDSFIRRAVADASLARCDRGRLVMFEEATHWVQHEEPDRVNRLLLDFLAAGSGPTEAGDRSRS
jgi:pimeloyl-ACP methyl ester carboxylesterase